MRLPPLQYCARQMNFTILKIDCFDFREPPEEDKGAESSRQSAKPSFERFFIF